MPITTEKLGPGILSFGVGPLAVQAQVTDVTIKWTEKVTSTPAIDVLSGEQVPEEEEVEYRAVLEFTALQDKLGAADLLAWSWTNKGTTQPFNFQPNTGTARKASGSVRVVPLNLGGKVKTRNTSTTTWACPIGSTPIIGAA